MPTTFVPQTWTDVRPGDIVVYTAFSMRSSKHVTRRMLVGTASTRRSVTELDRLCSLRGLYVTKAGEPVARQPRFGAHDLVSFKQVATVTRRDNRTADVATAYTEAWVEHGLQICDALDAEALATPEPESVTATVEVDMSEFSVPMGGWGQPDGMLGERMTIDPAVGPDYTGGAFTATMRANTPAEARTGTSDRMAAALAELAEMRREYAQHPTWNAGKLRQIDHIVTLLNP